MANVNLLLKLSGLRVTAITPSPSLTFTVGPDALADGNISRYYTATRAGYSSEYLAYQSAASNELRYAIILFSRYWDSLSSSVNKNLSLVETPVSEDLPYPGETQPYGGGGVPSDYADPTLDNVNVGRSISPAFQVASERRVGSSYSYKMKGRSVSGSYIGPVLYDATYTYSGLDMRYPNLPSTPGSRSQVSAAVLNKLELDVIDYLGDLIIGSTTDELTVNRKRGMVLALLHQFLPFRLSRLSTSTIPSYGGRYTIHRLNFAGGTVLDGVDNLRSVDVTNVSPVAYGTKEREFGWSSFVSFVNPEHTFIAPSNDQSDLDIALPFWYIRLEPKHATLTEYVLRVPQFNRSILANKTVNAEITKFPIISDLYPPNRAFYHSSFTSSVTRRRGPWVSHVITDVRVKFFTKRTTIAFDGGEVASLDPSGFNWLQIFGLSAFTSALITWLLRNGYPTPGTRLPEDGLSGVSKRLDTLEKDIKNIDIPVYFGETNGQGNTRRGRNSRTNRAKN